MPDDKEVKAIVNRLAKAIGHTQSVKNMVENGRDCSEVLIQLAAVKSAVNNTGKEILRIHLNQIVQDAASCNDTERIKEISRLIEIYMKQ